MKKKLCTTIVTMLTSTLAFAQLVTDSTVTVIDELKVPISEKPYVANTSFHDNWYFGVYGGATMSFGSDASHVGIFDKVGPAFTLTVGKQTTPVSDFRMMLGYTRNTSVTDDSFTEFGKPEYNHNTFKFNALSLSLDYLLNFTNLVCGFKENRKFNFKGIFGIGGSLSGGYNNEKYGEFFKEDLHKQVVDDNKYNSSSHYLLNARIGVGATFRLNTTWNLNLEAVGNILDNSFDSNPKAQNPSDGHIDFLLGVVYNFKGKDGKKSGFYHPLHDLSYYNKRINEIEELREKTNKRIEEVAAEIPDTVTINARVVYTLIAFDEGNDAIDDLQQTNIYTTASAWAKEPTCDIYITNSTAANDNLFKNRAKSIEKVLIERYNVPTNKIKIIADEKVIKSRTNYIVFIVND